MSLRNIATAAALVLVSSFAFANDGAKHGGGEENKPVVATGKKGKKVEAPKTAEANTAAPATEGAPAPAPAPAHEAKPAEHKAH